MIILFATFSKCSSASIAIICIYGDDFVIRQKKNPAVAFRPMNGKRSERLFSLSNLHNPESHYDLSSLHLSFGAVGDELKIEFLFEFYQAIFIIWKS